MEQMKFFKTPRQLVKEMTPRYQWAWTGISQKVSLETPVQTRPYRNDDIEFKQEAGFGVQSGNFFDGDMSPRAYVQGNDRSVVVARYSGSHYITGYSKEQAKVEATKKPQHLDFDRSLATYILELANRKE